MKYYFLFLLVIVPAIISAECTEDDCGPPLGMPNYLCSDGITVAGPGDCIEFADGSCGWEIIFCPESEFTGYLRYIEISACQDYCSAYNLETEEGEYLFAFEDGIAFFDPETQRRVPVTEEWEPGKKTRMNDGRVDRQGRFVVGGFSEVRHISGMVHERGRRMVMHGYQSNILLASNMQIQAAWPADEPVEYSVSLSPLRWELTDENLEVGDDGRVARPEGPGLGVTLNRETVERFHLPK